MQDVVYQVTEWFEENHTMLNGTKTKEMAIKISKAPSHILLKPFGNYVIWPSTHSAEWWPPLESLSHCQVDVCIIITGVSLGGL